ncbi:MAG: hypothetical protein CMJ78_03885 [Planctomycetaceae bacterium]|nr:hypothetical protein [Planctomycetaceae bacterium]
MTKFGKVLAILTLFFSLMFLGFTWVNYSGGVNWQGVAAEKELISSFSFTYVPGETPTWTTSKRVGTETLPQQSSLPAAIINARKDLITEQETRIGELDTQTPTIVQRATLLLTWVTADKQGMAERQLQLMDDLKAENEEIDRLSAQADQVARDTVSVQSTTTLRREDVFRLRQQLAELRTDQFQIGEQRRKLEDLLTRMKGVNGKLKRRQDQLISGGAKPDYETDPEPPSAAAANSDSAE